MAEGKLSDKTVIVTGGGRGLGRSITFGLARDGANVCVAAHIEDDIVLVKKEAEKITGGGQIIAILADLRSPEACRQVLDKTMSTFSSIFGLVNSAGLTFTYIAPHRYRRGYSEKFFELSDDVVQNVMDTNFVAADRMARLVTPHFIEQGVGRLVNVTTTIETMTKPGSSPYGPSKAALENASEIWVKDLEGTGVTVNILNPGGAANTEGFEISEDRAIASEVVGGMVEPGKMVAPICWLMSDDAPSITGMRYDARYWDQTKPPAEEASRIGCPLGLTLKPHL